MITYAQESNSENISLSIYGGLKLPEDNLNSDAGPWFGISINLPTGLGWSIQPDYNFWKVNHDARLNGIDLYSSEWSLLIAYKWNWEQFSIQSITGPGIISSGNSLFGEDRDYLVSFNGAVKMILEVSKKMDVYLHLRKQWSGSLDAGGGPAYSSWLIGIGTQFKFN